MFRSVSDKRAALEQKLDAHECNLQTLRQQEAIYAAGEKPLHLLNKIKAEEQEIKAIEAELRRLDEAVEAEAQKPRRETPYWRYGCALAVVFIVIVAGVLKFTGALDRLLAQSHPPTPTPTKTPRVALSPTTTDTPTLTPTPSPTLTSTPYYVEIVVDASERMSDKFEGGTTKMEAAWQTAGTIARIRAQQKQFVTVRLFGGGDSEGGSCHISHSLFDFTNDGQQIANYLAESPDPAGEAAVVKALLDAAQELDAYGKYWSRDHPAHGWR